MSGHDPTRSKISLQTQMNFLKAEWSESLANIPGIGPATVGVLAAKGITTQYQFAGQFLAFKGATTTEKEWFDASWHFLTKIGVKNGHKSVIIDCLGVKLEIAFPGIYTAGLGAFGEEEEEEEDGDDTPAPSTGGGGGGGGGGNTSAE